VKLHDLKPAPGSRKERTRVGRGIAAGKGKTAGRGTKGQKSRAGASIPAWFEGGQTPIHVRVPKLRGFKRRFKVEYQVVNVGRISEYAAAGRFGVESKEPLTVNAEVLASAGLIGTLRRPVKVLGLGDVDRKLFVAADAFTASARRKIEDAGGFVQQLAPAEPETGAEPEAGAEPAEEPAPSAEAPAEAPEERAAAAEPGTDGAATESPAPAEPETADAAAAEGGDEPVAEQPARSRRRRSEPAAEGADGADEEDDAAGRGRRSSRRKTEPED
jgi:large subunit ribosomal protein L15